MPLARSDGRASRTAVGAYTIGLTGAPGAGKSTLTSGLVGRIRADGDEVAVLAVDPSSPFSGGAILGDRVRMEEHALDDGVFIRSMASRGHLGGLALATPEAVRVLDAAGRPWIVVETVGVGQVEVDVAGAADTTVVVVNPGWGDAVQANKAGLMEIADLFVINKADRAGADGDPTRPRVDARPVRGRRVAAAGREHRGVDRRGRRRALDGDPRAPGLPRRATGGWRPSGPRACATSSVSSSPSASGPGPRRCSTPPIGRRSSSRSSPGASTPTPPPTRSSVRSTPDLGTRRDGPAAGRL